MPTYETTRRFERDFDGLTAEQKEAFLKAVRQFVADLGAGKSFQSGLRVKGVRSAKGIFEMTWAPDGRATFQYGASLKAQEPHIIWRRCGTHDVFHTP